MLLKACLCIIKNSINPLFNLHTRISIIPHTYIPIVLLIIQNALQNKCVTMQQRLQKYFQ